MAHAIAYHERIGVKRHIASGSQKWVNVVVHHSITEAYAALRNSGFRILTAHCAEQGQEFKTIDYTQSTALVVGAELDGLSHEAIEQADGHIIIYPDINDQGEIIEPLKKHPRDNQALSACESSVT